MTLTGAWLVGGAAALLLFVSSPAVAALGYSVSFEGAPNELRDEFGAISKLARGEREIPTLTAISIIARRDARSLENALRAGGYYAGSVTPTVRTDGAGGKPEVIFKINAGARFHIAQYQIVYEDDRDDERPRSLSDAGVKANGSADGASLQRIQQDFLHSLWNHGYPAARIVGRRAEADIANTSATAVFVFDSGPRAKFGPLMATGDVNTARAYLEKLKTWKEGDVFERTKLVKYRDRLSATGLFTTVSVSPGAPDNTGAAPVIVDLQERKRRTIGAGLSYSTAEGPGGRLFFEYRNLFHHGERARTELQGSGIAQSLTFNFDKPLPAFPGSTFAELKLQNQTTDAFDARTAAVSGGVARNWLDGRLETRGGIALETSKVRTETTEERSYLVSAPLSATWNTEDSVLDPTKGVRASLSVTPYTGDDSFTIAELIARTRFLFGPDNRLTTAFRARLGASFGSSLVDLPQNKRFYSGGGGSIRGYDFQAAGPLDANGKPIGGRSVAEAAFETRVRVLRKFQLAAFVDAGTVSADNFPDLGGDYFVGVGGGARYLTSIGPIRIDVATPLEKRATDRSFQIYISLGQSF